MRADLYGQEIDRGHFRQEVGISTVSGVVSGGVGRGISGNMTRAASGLLKTDNPGMNAVITAAIASGASGAGTNFAMQLGNMALFDENGNLNFDLNRVSLDNMDWNSVMNSGIVGVAQSVAMSVAQRASARTPEQNALDDNGDARVGGANQKQLEVITNTKDNIANETNQRKGNFGEICTDIDVETNGPVSKPGTRAERVGNNRITDIDAPGHQGIDGIYKCESPPPDYIIVEAKYRSDGRTPPMSVLKDKTVQMNDDWIYGERVDKYFGITPEIPINDPKRIPMNSFLEAAALGNVQKEVSTIDVNGNVTRSILK
jgi:hypothetical protein